MPAPGLDAGEKIEQSRYDPCLFVNYSLMKETLIEQSKYKCEIAIVKRLPIPRAFSPPVPSAWEHVSLCCSLFPHPFQTVAHILSSR